ncbi:hypothetical protein Scep_023956 [Stephania cephalantha]|uniref:DDE Tnp4 domain-containing protein n=1 Tax=Stephania cephalantha TaxID=152367 RepID=A0AAP0EWR1_9MAGN
MAGTKRRSAAAKKRKKPPQKPQDDLSHLISSAASAAAVAHIFLSDNDLHLLPSQTLSLESKIASAAHSLSTLHSLLQSPSPPPPSLSSSSSSSSNPSSWFDRFVPFSESPDNDARWVEAFRMSKSSFGLLLSAIKNSSSLQNSGLDLGLDRVLGIALFRLAHGGSYKAVGRRFGVASDVACRCFFVACKAVNDGLGHLLEFSPDMRRGFVGFGSGSLPNCCGVLGFSRVLVEGGGSVIVQGMVDWEGRFMDVSAGWHGSIEPSVILSRSKLFSRVEESKELLLNGPLIEIDATLIPQYVLGDACCPLLQWVMTPFSIPNTECDSYLSEKAFNSVHGEAMRLVRTAFGRVKAGWQLLSMKWKKESVEFLPFIVVTGCLLHNFLLQCGEGVADENVDDFDEHWGFANFEGDGDESGERIRNALASQLSRVSKSVDPNFICE